MSAIGHNGGPPLDPAAAVMQEIEDLFAESLNFADGEPIGDEAMHDAITTLRDAIHEAGKRADEMRIAEKKPHDDAAAAVQARWNPLIQAKKGKVDQAKAALGDLLAAWRKKKADELARIAAAKAAEAARLVTEAQAAIRATSGNLAARVAAEELAAHAKTVVKDAKRADKAATTGTGLRTKWQPVMVKAEDALEWAYKKDEAAFLDLVQSMAETAVLHGARSLPGFRVDEMKVAN